MREVAAGLFASLVALAFCPPSAAAQERPVTLQEALRIAEAGNPELLAARERAAAQAERAGAVRSQRLPRAFATVAWSRSDTPAAVFANKLNAGAFAQEDFAIARLNDPAALSHLGSQLVLEAPIDLIGRVRDQADAQAASGRALERAAGEALLELRLRVSQAYRRAHLAERGLDVARRALDAARSREDQLAARVGEGAALEADRLRARARRRLREAELAEREADLEVALAGLARTLGATADERYRPVEPASAPGVLDADVATWLERAQNQRPALQAARERSEAARLQRRAEDRTLWPELGAFARFQDDRNTFGSGQSLSFGLGLRIDLFDRGRGRRAAAAAADQRAADQESRAELDQVRLEVTTALRRALAARERHAAAEGGAVEGREALRVVHERRLAGLATLTDELETEADALSAELREIQAATDAALADAALRRAAGEP